MLLAALCVIGIAGVTDIGSARAQAVDEDALNAKLEIAEGMRDVKTLQRSYAQYMQYGLWDAIGDLFAEEGELVWDDETIEGPDAITDYLGERFGDGTEGLKPGATHTQLIMTPVITFDDESHATGRWHEILMTGQLGEHAEWGGNLQVNDYVKEDGVWRIARMEVFPIFEGLYEEGWSNVTDDLPVIPYHYTPDDVGSPYPEEFSATSGSSEDVPARVAALRAEDEIRNLQNAYGYYLDRRMWGDITDLFTTDGTLEILGVGTYVGKAGIRRWLERTGPGELRHGELFDHPQIHTLVEVSPSGVEARARGLELGMVGRNWGDAYWSLTTFDNRFVKEDGVWKLAKMRLAPAMKTDFFKGWGESAIPVTAPVGPYAPNQAAEPVPEGEVLVPAFFDHPVTGDPVTLPEGLTEVANPLSDAPAAKIEMESGQLQATLDQAMAWDTLGNVSAAFGNWIDDFQWRDFADLWAEEGSRKAPGVGYYEGRENIFHMQMTRSGPTRDPRTFIPVHLRIQPVIHVSEDATTAKVRARLLQFNSGWESEGSLVGGMYEDVMVLEDDVWKIHSSVIEHIWRTPGYDEGWARVPENAGEMMSRPVSAEFLAEAPPDRPLDGPAFAPFPSIGPLWFHYRNPVTGQAPANNVLPD